MAEYTGMTPTVVIGVGGTGKEILIKIRRMIVETYGSLDALPIVSFLHIDTEQNAKVSESQTVLKQDISLRPVEQVWAKVEDAKAILNRLTSYPYLAEWFPASLKGTDTILAGAGQIRALGRFAFTVNYQQIKTAFNSAKGRIRGHEKRMLDQLKVQLDQGINIFVVGSLSGGTGSGMLMDLAYNLRDWVPPSELPQSSAYLVLPGAFSGLGDRVIANAYAALMELDHYSRSDTRFEAQYSTSQSDRIGDQAGRDVPFNFCYLVGNSNNKVTFPSLEAVLEMVSQNIFLDFSSGFSQYKKLVRDNIRKHWAGPDPLGYPQSFITFGLSSIQFPVERVINACASRLAKRTVQWWVNPTPTPTSMRDVIQTEILPGMLLAESENQHQILDSIAMGTNAKPYSKEVADWMSGLRKRRNDLQIPFENLQRFLNIEQEKYAVHFNDGDTDPRRWSDFFQTMWDNYSRLAIQRRAELREAVAKMVEDRFRGPKFARQFLEVLSEVLADYKLRFDQDRQKDWIARERSAANALQVLTKQIDDFAKQFLILDRRKKVDEAFNAAMQAMETVYISKVEVKSRTLGVLLLDALREEALKLLSDLSVLDRLFESLQAQFADKEQTYIRETRTLTVNGILLYDEKDVDQIYSSAIGDREGDICSLLSQKALTASNARLFDLQTFDSFRVRDLLGRVLDAALDEFVGRAGVARISAARKFLEIYPTVEQQEAQIKTTFEKSEVFLRFSQDQARLGWDDKPEKRQTLVGIQGGNKPEDPAVATLLPYIRKTSTITDKDIRPLDEPQRLFFVQEVGAFPLRLIEGMSRMRSLYRAVRAADRNPLHTHTDEARFQDIMPASEDEVQVRRNVRLARALALITLVENRLTGYTEARLRYSDRQTGIERTETVGNDWKSTIQFLSNDANRRLKDILGDELARLAQAPTTRPARQEFYLRLMQHLDDLRGTIEGGEDNLEYQETREAIEEYIRTYNLYIEGTVLNRGTQPPAPEAPVPAPAASDTPAPGLDSNLDKYRKLVETCVRDGVITQTEQALLDRFRGRYGISEAQSRQLIEALLPKKADKEAVLEYGLMYRAFLENDQLIDAEEQAQLLELQEELSLAADQVNVIETNVKEELGLN